MANIDDQMATLQAEITDREKRLLELHRQKADELQRQLDSERERIENPDKTPLNF